MKRLLTTLLVLFLFYFGIQIIMNRFGQGHNKEYTITNEQNAYQISEKYVANVKEETDNYYIEVIVNNNKFNMQIFYDFFGAEKIIKEIYYYETADYKCILPVFIGDKYLVDLLCLKDSVIYPYHTIKGVNISLDNYAISLKNFGYNSDLFGEVKRNPKTDGLVTAYPNNVSKNHYIGINNYRGLYTINSTKLSDVRLFSYDTYKRPLSVTVGKYYITADYNDKYSFNNFLVVDLYTNKKTEITMDYSIDFDSYIQGVVDSKVYIMDRANKKQYEITPSTNTVVLSGDIDTLVKQYSNGEWTRISAYEAASKDYIFNVLDSVSDATFTRIDKIGNVLSGYIYYFKKEANIYKVYRSSVQNNDIKTYLFQTNKISDVLYVNDYVYYTNGAELKYYHDSVGTKTVFNNSEFDFNASLYFNVYRK